MSKKIPVTQAMRVLKQHGIDYEPHEYAYEAKGGTARSSAELGVDEHQVIKTLVMQDEKAKPLIILMHGNCSVSTKNLARSIGVKSISPCDPDAATRHTGYQVGGTSPFGTRKKLPVYIEGSIFDLPRIYINGGRRGFLLSMAPQALQAVFPKGTQVEVAIQS